MKSYDPKDQEIGQYRFGNGGDDNELCLDFHSGESGLRCLLNKRTVNNLVLRRDFRDITSSHSAFVQDQRNIV